MNWLYYLLEANFYLVIFYCFYRVLLQNETFYNLNRYFLLGSTVISFALPVLQLGLLKLPNTQNIAAIQVVHTHKEITDLNWAYGVYLFIALGFAFKLSYSIYKIIKIWLNAKKHRAGKVTLVEVNDESTAFSFFNLLFIHPLLAKQPAVIKHEMVHIKQKHSFDVIFLELVQIISWFNPILHFIKKDLKLLHEYIADDLTTKSDMQKHEYALFLIQNSFGISLQSITNQIFNQSILKRRINMLNKKRTASWARLRLLLVLPLTGTMLCVSTMAFTKDYGYLDLLPEKSEPRASVQDPPKVKNVIKRDQVKFPPPIVKVDKPSKLMKSPPPPVEPPPAPKRDRVKFPPPIVKANKSTKLVKSPPPPVEPPPAPKRDQVKFPPPIVKADKPSKLLKSPPPPVEPPPAPKRGQVKFPPPLVKPAKGELAPPPPAEPLAPKKNISTKTPSPQP